ncbi:Chromosome partitioning ATPase, Mrp family, contains Fe-S cluster [Rhizobium tibeticum]|uniref:Chromosome partitioning ATPase, Mrp family, contains Fe-S cluster n=2 Tax=Rhizobium TaxID=379 RepID=A0A1H8IF01_9HYPH|nr:MULTISPECIES: CpsD/CapB family tyrosine-protein kinase [Rhizobium]MCS0457994.1 CpsD/CapB family tyrosine-protein kinase [Rhizobium favelukesii]UFS79899.1 CpsD/CapB family tyrosine-protein kinase [Rhizobium sp. T136]CDM61612.1 ATPase involved in chromosome partitioning [Rhizobium favelukesii]SEH70467.1 Tyrosine-protein kinase YwqD [Rhizobium tibeticum]SEN66298.1 Chromosome partitioning ATPase, Mrp family, contains Fe-S cluster [Rhizobium tibeticum]
MDDRSPALPEPLDIVRGAWEGLPPLVVDHDAAANNRVITLNGSSPAHAAFDMMRTKLLRLLRENKWTSVAITSPTPSCGKTCVALNLAFSLANQGDCRTVLVDLDLRRPQIGKALGIKNSGSIESFLKGDAGLRETFFRYGDNLAIAPNRQPMRFSAELLQSGAASQSLQAMRQEVKPDVILYDLPPMLSTDDVLAFLPNVDGVILVAASDQSTMSEVDICEQSLQEKTNVLGVVLNKSQHSQTQYGY